MKSGVLIVLEGIDGSGKSTLAKGIAEAVRAAGRTVLLTREPTDGPYGQQIRALARTGRDAVSAEEELALFQADRAQHVRERVRPALARGEVVVQDRSYFSTVAYQGERGLDRGALLRECEAIAPRPDVLLVVDVPAEVGVERIRCARALPADDFEGLESLRRVRSVFLSLRDATVLDGTATPDQVLSRALEQVLPKI